MISDKPILVTGAAGKIGAVGFKIVKLLRSKDIPVRAMVRQLDDRSEALSNLGAEVVIGDLTNIHDVYRVMKGCDRLYFGISVSSCYLEATCNMAVTAKHLGIDVFVNMSQMTVSQMNITQTTSSPQQQQHWLAENVLNWSGLPTVQIRSTVFLEHFFFHDWAAKSIIQDKEIRLPFGEGKTSPIATEDVAKVISEILISPSSHVGKIYELTGAKSQNLDEISKEYSQALGFPIKYVNVPFGEWEKNQLKDFPQHLREHIKTMAILHKENRYDRFTNTVEEITGSKPKTIKEWVEEHISEFK